MSYLFHYYFSVFKAYLKLLSCVYCVHIFCASYVFHYYFSVFKDCLKLFLCLYLCVRIFCVSYLFHCYFSLFKRCLLQPPVFTTYLQVHYSLKKQVFHSMPATKLHLRNKQKCIFISRTKTTFWFLLIADMCQINVVFSQ